MGLFLFAITSVFAQQRHDSAVFLIDLSETVCVSNNIEQAKKIAVSMNQKFPGYVKSGGALTFGNLAYPQENWIAPVKSYDRAGLHQALSNITEGQGSTPIGSAIYRVGFGLESAEGKKALIIISDGLDNGATDPVEQIKTLKAKYSSDLCVFTIQLGDNPLGASLLSKLADAGSCGKSVSASQLQSDAEVQSLVDYIFPPEVVKTPAKPEPKPEPKPTPAPVIPRDKDGDGVVDENDQCPGTPKGAKVNDIGCWIIQGLEFDTDSAVIKEKYFANLDEAVEMLKQNPEIKIVIEGHTDDVGDAKYNQVLSEKRAKAVMDYMIAKGIAKERLSTKGYGESKPIASNKTAEGRAENRRVELSLVNQF